MALQYDREFIKCRTVGHTWEAINPNEKHKGGWLLALRCTTCKTERWDTIRRDGELESRAYKYPEGYHLADKMSKDVWRVELRRYVDSFISEYEMMERWRNNG